ncbi:MAG: MarR family winged helix-turn-helix transcriptional regulator [Acidimicrobiia bacterium]
MSPPERPLDPISEAHRQWVAHDLPAPLAMTAVISIVRAEQLVTTAVDRALRPLDLTFARYEVLMLLKFSRRGALPITTMGGRLMIHPTGITKLIDKLEQRGLVRREPNPLDRRGTLARITPVGRRLATRASKTVGDISFGLDLDAGRLQEIIDVMQLVRTRHDPHAATRSQP